MASLSQTPSGVFYLAFRFEGDRFNRSLETKDRADAQQQKAIVERTLKHLKQGVLEIADNVSSDQLWQFLRSGGKQVAAPRIVRSVKLSVFCKQYLSSFADSAKEATTLDTERHHLNHFQRLLGKGTTFESISAAELQNYLQKRQQEKGNHGSRVKPVTIGKELQTFQQLWQFAKARGYVSGNNPTGGVRKPRGSQKPPFMTWGRKSSGVFAVAVSRRVRLQSSGNLIPA